MWLHLADQVLDAVPDAGVAELAEVGQVLADLRVGQVQALAELFGRDGPAVGALERLQLAQVQAEPPDGGIGERRRCGSAPCDGRLFQGVPGRQATKRITAAGTLNRAGEDRSG